MNLINQFINNANNFISSEIKEKHRFIAKEIFNYILENYDDELDYRIPIKDCIPLKSKKSNFKSISISKVNDRLLLHFPNEHRVVGKNLLNIYKVNSKFDPYSKTQIDVKYDDIVDLHNIQQTLDYTFEHLR